MARQPGASAQAFRDEHGGTALHRAAVNGFALCAKEILRVEPTVVDVTDTTAGNAALHYACAYGHNAVVDVLLRLHARVDTPNAKGNTPLHLAAMEGRTMCAQLLLDAGANADMKNRQFAAPLRLADRFGKVDVAEVLRRHRHQKSQSKKRT